MRDQPSLLFGPMNMQPQRAFVNNTGLNDGARQNQIPQVDEQFLRGRVEVNKAGLQKLATDRGNEQKIGSEELKEALSNGKLLTDQQTSMNLLERCFDPLLKFKQRSVLSTTINQDLMTKLKMSLAHLQRQLTPSKPGQDKNGNKKTSKVQKDKADISVTAEYAINEVVIMSQLVTNIELMQSEAESSLELFIGKTQELNSEIEYQFDQFRSRPTKTKNFTDKDKNQIR